MGIYSGFSTPILQEIERIIKRYNKDFEEFITALKE
jgi:hypothetical protein